ncbi:hypothetical protein T06_9236 [Trichinella sp. T6]|nr:hypothetical protein T06_9236 [Trichinella sp. T6]
MCTNCSCNFAKFSKPVGCDCSILLEGESKFLSWRLSILLYF